MGSRSTFTLVLLLFILAGASAASAQERYDYFDRLPPANQYRDFERYGNAYRVKIHVRVELWIYNHGSSRFMDYVRLENGIVRRVYSGGYGY